MNKLIAVVGNVADVRRLAEGSIDQYTKLVTLKETLEQITRRSFDTLEEALAGISTHGRLSIVFHGVFPNLEEAVAAGMMEARPRTCDPGDETLPLSVAYINDVFQTYEVTDPTHFDLWRFLKSNPLFPCEARVPLRNGEVVELARDRTIVCDQVDIEKMLSRPGPEQDYSQVYRFLSLKSGLATPTLGLGPNCHIAFFTSDRRRGGRHE